MVTKVDVADDVDGGDSSGFVGRFIGSHMVTIVNELTFFSTYCEWWQNRANPRSKWV
jgi:hypothetical protein